MDTQYKTSSLGHDIVIAVPLSVEEYNKLSKRAEGCLEDAVDHEVAHGTLGEVRKAFVKAIEVKTGIDRLQIDTGKKVVKEGKEVSITKAETEGDYYDRVCAELKLDPENEPFANIAKTLSAGGSAEVKFNPAASPRQPAAPKKLAEQYKTSAKGNLEKLDDAKINKALSKFLPDVKFVRTNTDADHEALGWLLKKFEAARLAAGSLLS